MSLITLAPGRGHTSVPSNVVGYMAAGRPVVASVNLDCDTAEVIRSSGCGIVVPPGDADALADAVEALLADADKRRLGFAFENQYGAEAALSRYADVLETLGRERKQPA